MTTSPTSRTLSPGHTTYFIDPNQGSDEALGTNRATPWRTFVPLNRLVLAPGDRVEIIAPGAFHESLVLAGAGSREEPVTVHFTKGRYDFYADGAARRQYYISNCNGDAEGEKAIGILFEHARHIQLSGPGARIVYRGKMIEICVDHSEDIIVSGLEFDYHRPTVSEFTVVTAAADYADLAVHRDSVYRIEDGRIVWEGEGWECGPQGRALLAQCWNPDTELLQRCRDPLEGLVVEELDTVPQESLPVSLDRVAVRTQERFLRHIRKSPNHQDFSAESIEEQAPGRLRVHGDHVLTLGHVYQLRDPFRDCAGVFVNRSRDVTFRNLNFFFLHGMGVLCQFTENIMLDRVAIAPDPDSGRTSAAWADCFHASGCRGTIRVTDGVFDGAHDDAINIHGTYLRIIETPADHRVTVRFMHPQTYGFQAFYPGDEIQFVRWDNLEPYGVNQVRAVEQVDLYEWVLTLAQPMPGDWRPNDVIENLTWNPEVEIRGCTVRHIPTRGFLLSSCRSMRVTDCTFERTRSSAIQVGGEAEQWFESGGVRDLVLSGNRFLRCAKAAVDIRPEKQKKNDAVHRNIGITGNEFRLEEGEAVEAESTTELTITGNRVYSSPITDSTRAFVIRDCAEVRIGDNEFADS